MESINIWTILGIATVILLALYFKNRNAVWGGFTTGIILGFVVVLFSAFGENEFTWSTIGKGAILGTVVGFAAELLGRGANLLRSRS